MQGTPEEIDNAIAALVEEKLLVLIRDIYEDVGSTSKEKKEQRTKCTEKFISMCEQELSISADRIKKIVDNVIAQTKWIEEIEELDEGQEI